MFRILFKWENIWKRKIIWLALQTRPPTKWWSLFRIRKDVWQIETHTEGSFALDIFLQGQRTYWIGWIFQLWFNLGIFWYYLCIIHYSNLYNDCVVCFFEFNKLYKLCSKVSQNNRFWIHYRTVNCIQKQKSNANLNLVTMNTQEHKISSNFGK